MEIVSENGAVMETVGVGVPVWKFPDVVTAALTLPKVDNAHNINKLGSINFIVSRV